MTIRLELTPAVATLTAAAGGEAGDQAEMPTRQVAGLAVPYDVEATVGFRRVTFAPGSVTFTDRAPLLLGHDANQPVGVLAEATDSPTGVRAAYRVDATPEGDRALTQAQSGSRAGLSVGVDVHRFEASDEDPDRIRVLEATAVETSLVSLSAYATAGVDRVAAHHNREDRPMPDDEQRDTPAAPALTDDQLERVVATIDAARDQRRLVVAEPLPDRMRLGEYCTNLVRAHRGDAAAAQRLEAALTRETIASEQGVIPVAYVDQIIDAIAAPRPLHDALAKAEMPPAGMTIRRPKVTQTVDSAANTDSRWLADDTSGMPSGALTIGNDDTAVLQWAFGGSASVALVERSQPSYIEEAFAQMVKAYYRDVERKIAGAFPTSASTATSIGTATALFMATYRDWPDLLVLGGTAYGKLLDATGILRYSSGQADAGGQATIAGMKVAASPDVATADAWVTASDFLETRESTPLRLTVADVGGLSVEIGLTSFYAQTFTRGGAGAAIRIPAFVPAADAATANKAGK